jgi:hypothetical protein
MHTVIRELEPEKDAESKRIQIILTFGLLSQNKGIENVLRALPDVISQYLDLVYLTLGATHPMVKKS